MITTYCKIVKIDLNGKMSGLITVRSFGVKLRPLGSKGLGLKKRELSKASVIKVMDFTEADTGLKDEYLREILSKPGDLIQFKPPRKGGGKCGGGGE